MQRHISQFVWRLDYAGIATLIVTSFYPPVYYGFMCHRFYLAFYLITTTAMGEQADKGVWALGGCQRSLAVPWGSALRGYAMDDLLKHVPASAT